MIYLLSTNYYRVLRDKRLLNIMLFYFSVNVLTGIMTIIAPSLIYTGNSETIASLLPPDEGLSVLTIMRSMTTSDVMIVTVIYSMFFFADEIKGRVFENMCTIYKDRFKVFISSYITICSTVFFFMVVKVAIMAVFCSVYKVDLVLGFDRVHPAAFVTWLSALCLYIAVFYSLYIITRTLYIPLIAWFGPYTVVSSPRFMNMVPFIGKKLYLVCELLVAKFPLLLMSMAGSWRDSLPLIVIQSAVIAVLLLTDSIIIEKRDVC